MLVIESITTCSISCTVTPASAAYRTAECVPPSVPALTAIANFTNLRVFSSSGPALWNA
jgi:hypothetical protein